ncbi:unnamed protein product [Camellia sinensis]
MSKKIRFGKTLSYAKLKNTDLEILVNLVGDKERYLKSHMNFLFCTPFIQNRISCKLISIHDLVNVFYNFFK